MVEKPEALAERYNSIKPIIFEKMTPNDVLRSDALKKQIEVLIKQEDDTIRLKKAEDVVKDVQISGAKNDMMAELRNRLKSRNSQTTEKSEQ